MTQTRNSQVDVARGIAIILVVFGHSFYSLDEPLNKAILTFHMPLFFLLSGIVAKTADMIKMSMWTYTLSKLRTILLPQILLGVLSYVYFGLYTVVMKGGSLSEVPFLYQFWRYWFLQVLYTVVMLFYLLSRIINLNNRSAQIGTMVVCLITGLIISYVFDFPDESPFYFNVVPMAMFFYVLGFTLKPFLLKHWNQFFSNTAKKVTMLIIMLVTLGVCSRLNSSVTMYNNGYGNCALFLLGCFSGIFAVWIAAGLFENNSFLKWCGMNSIIIYVWQFVLTQLMKNVVEILMSRIFPLCPTIVMSIIVLFLCIATVIPIVILSNQFIPELYGKMKKG